MPKTCDYRQLSPNMKLIFQKDYVSHHMIKHVSSWINL